MPRIRRLSRLRPTCASHQDSRRRRSTQHRWWVRLTAGRVRGSGRAAFDDAIWERHRLDLAESQTGGFKKPAVFGVGAFLLPLFAVGMGIRWFRSHKVVSPVAKLLGGIWLLMFVPALLA